MKRKFYTFMVLAVLHCLFFSLYAQNNYAITAYKNVQIKVKNKYLLMENCEGVSETDSIKFGKAGSIALFNPKTGLIHTRAYSNITLPVSILVTEVKQEASLINRISDYIRHFIYPQEKQGTSLQSIKSEIDNDSIQAIPVEVYRFLKSNQKNNNDSISGLIYCQLNTDEKHCTVANDSEFELYIDVLHVDDKGLLSIFSPMLDWVSGMSVPPHSERTFWFTGEFQFSDQYILVGSKKGLPLNGIFKLYRPGVEYKDRQMNIELILKKL